MSYDSVTLMRNQAHNSDMKIAIIKFVKLQDTINFPFYIYFHTINRLKKPDFTCLHSPSRNKKSQPSATSHEGRREHRENNNGSYEGWKAPYFSGSPVSSLHDTDTGVNKSYFGPMCRITNLLTTRSKFNFDMQGPEVVSYI